MKNVIELNSLKFSYASPDTPVLDIDRLNLSQGEKLLIKGPSGSGKTSLLSLIGGVLEASSGEVKVLETRFKSMSGLERDRFRADHIGFIFQLFNLLPYLNVLENLGLACQFSKIRRDRISGKSTTPRQEAERLLSHMGVGVELFSRKPGELSVGQQQRVAVARALMGAPELIIADEPTSSLDYESRDNFLSLLFKEVALNGSSLIFVSHDPSIEAHFDRCIDLVELNKVAGGSSV